MSTSDDSTERMDAASRVAQQRREWVIERIGWGLMACLIVVALLGGLGFGPLTSRRSISRDGALSVKYYAVERTSAATKLEVWCKTGDPTAKEMDVAISRSFVDEITIESFSPEPTEMALAGDKIIFTFVGTDLANGEKVVCHYRHNEFGLRKYEIAIAGGQPVRISQVVLP